MSFYLGKKTNGQGLMVATTEEKTIAQLKAVNPLNCEFHSDLPFLTYKRFDAVVRDIGHVTYTTGYLWDPYSGPTYSVVTAEFPEAFYSNYADRHLIVIIDNEFSLSHFTTTCGIQTGFVGLLPTSPKLGQKWVSRLGTGSGTNYPGYEPVFAPSSVKRYLLVPKRLTNLSYTGPIKDAPYSVPQVSVLVTNYKLDGTYVSPAVNDYSAGIKVKNNSFFINGYDLFNLNYLSSVGLSDSDIEIETESASFFLVGEDDSVPGMQLLSAPGRTKLIKGNNVIFDTIYGRRSHIYAGNYSYSENQLFFYGEKGLYVENDLINVPLTVPISSAPTLNVIVTVKITSTNIKHNNSLISGNSDIIYNGGVKSYGAMTFALADSTPILVGHDEYTYHYGPTEAVTFRFYKAYVYRAYEFGQYRLRIRIIINEQYANSGANVLLEVKSIMFV